MDDGNLVYGFKDGYRVVKNGRFDAQGMEGFSFSPASSTEQGAGACATLEMQAEVANGKRVEALSLVIDNSCGQNGGPADLPEDKKVSK